MKRLKTSLFAAAGILTLALVLNSVGPKRVMAALGYTPVRDVDQPARQPFGITFSATIPNGQYSATSFPITVPPNKRLAIESISPSITVPPGQDAEINVFLSTGGNPVILRPAMTFRAANLFGSPGDHYSTINEVHAYADPGTNISFGAIRNSTVGDAGAALTLTGHLVDLP
jgi:hypothetical protein